jgi:serine/threonine protein kinase
MHDWALIDHYATYSSRWFESPAKYVPTTELFDICREALPEGWLIERSGLWYVATPPDGSLQNQGWKFHISVNDDRAKECLLRTIEVLRPEAVPFKFLVDEFTLQQSNGKLWPRASSGKFITVYPDDLEQFQNAGAWLNRALQDFEGPYVLTDRRWPGSRCVFYRYGAFRRRRVLRPDGTSSYVISGPDGSLVVDRRSPYWDPPEWVVDPVASAPGTGGVPLLGGGRYSVTSALQFSNRGGVYRGVDHRTENAVAIKEARPCITLGRHRVDAVEALEKEYRILHRLEDTGMFVRAVDFFQQDGHAFLVEDYVDGAHLGHTTITTNPLYRGLVSRDDISEYLELMRQIWRQLAQAITMAHDRRIVLGDLSFANILVKSGGAVCLVDLECAVEEGVDRHIGLFTPGMASPRTLKSGVASAENDYFALGAIIFGSIMLATSFCGFYPDARPRFLAELKADLALPGELVEVIEFLYTSDSEGRKPESTGSVAIQALSRPVRPPPTPPRLEVAGSSRLSRGGRRALVESVRDTRCEIARYLIETADTTREDRLFPGDLSVFETNSLSVAFGAAGVLYGLKRMTGSVPREFVDWFSNRPKGNTEMPPGLYLGQAGVAWVLNELNFVDEAISLMRSARRHDLLMEEPGILIGYSGYGLACLKLWVRELGDEFLEDAVRVGNHLVASAIEDERGIHWTDFDGGTSLGYGYGASGIALFLLYLSEAASDMEFEKIGRRALDFDLSFCVWRGDQLLGFPARVVDDIDGTPAVARAYWDAGSAGILTSVVRYLVGKPDAELRGWLELLTANVSQKYAVFPQLFHGLAGLGNALLDVWDFSGDERHLAEAWHLAEGIQLFRMYRPEGVGFPGEQAIRESADLATGAAGVGLFLDRLLKAEEGSRGSFNFVVDELLASGDGLRGMND